MINIPKLQKLSKDVAINVGSFLHSKKSDQKSIYSEVGRDIKLDLDREAEEIIRTMLAETKIPVQGEEFGIELSRNSELRWVVDPIDGTANYFRNLDQCCISIALMDGAECFIGTIYNFNNKELYSAAKGFGAYLNDEIIQVSNINSKSKASITTGFPATETVDSSIKFLDELKGWKKVRMFGSAALSCAYVASGKCDYYAEKGVYLWDFAAGICLVKEAGGSVRFSPIDEDRYEVVFSNNLL